MSDLTNTVQGSGDGGPAFPSTAPYLPSQSMTTADVHGWNSFQRSNIPTISYAGMSLRDWFAGQVLASAAALPFGATDYAHRAKIAYEQADTMLMARKVSP